MYLYKHPRETKENKIKLIRIIRTSSLWLPSKLNYDSVHCLEDWARPIFNLDTDYKLLTREERQQRDAEQASLKRQTSLTGKPKNRSAEVDIPFANNRYESRSDAVRRSHHSCSSTPRLRSIIFLDGKMTMTRTTKRIAHALVYLGHPTRTMWCDPFPLSNIPIERYPVILLLHMHPFSLVFLQGDEKKKTVSRLDELKRRHQDRKRLSKPMSIVKLSIEGNKMHL